MSACRSVYSGEAKGVLLGSSNLSVLWNMLLCSLKNNKEVRFSKRPLVRFDLCWPSYLFILEQGVLRSTGQLQSCYVHLSFKYWDYRCVSACSVGVVVGTGGFVHAR